MNMERRMRSATLEDVPFISECTRRAYSGYVPVLGRPARPVTADYAEMLMHSCISILEVERIPAGLIVLQTEKNTMLIYSVAVAPEYQHQGHGGFLMRFAEEEAGRLGIPEIRLYTNTLMTANIEIYHKLGYREVDREPYKGSVLVHMQKNF